MTRQEMFDRAVRGLHSQKFERCTTDDGYGYTTCIYADGTGKHCAWGWVDPEGTADVPREAAMTVLRLRDAGYGLARTLTPDDLGFASMLQQAHDRACDPKSVWSRLQEFAEQQGLTWPAECTVDWSEHEDHPEA